MINKCPCQNCNGHIEFEDDQIQTRVECPHCKMETLLFVPAVGQPVGLGVRRKKSGRRIAATVASVLFVAAFLWYGVKPELRARSKEVVTSQPANLKPVEGAFGYKLGDRFSGENTLVESKSEDFLSSDLQLLKDGRIYSIFSSGNFLPRYDFRDVTNRLVSVLNEKYGFRNLYISPLGNAPTYCFGTEDRAAELSIHHYDKDDTYYFSLEYYDRTLRDTAWKEKEAEEAGKNAAQKSSLQKDL